MSPDLDVIARALGLDEDTFRDHCTRLAVSQGMSFAHAAAAIQSLLAAPLPTMPIPETPDQIRPTRRKGRA